MSFEYFVTRGSVPDEKGHPCDALPEGDDWELVGPAQPVAMSAEPELYDGGRASGNTLVRCDLVWTWRRPTQASSK